MALDKIGHYSITNPATVYDEEALTALELAGRTAAKVNEAIGAFNKLEDDTDKHLAKQDSAIDKMIGETMPAKVVQEVEKKITDGTFDDQISEYLDDLGGRVDNLLGSVTEGSTTLDAEVIDMRVDAYGKTQPTAGEALRGQTRKANAHTFAFMNKAPIIEYSSTSITVTFPSAVTVFLDGYYKTLPKGISDTLTHDNATLFIVAINRTASNFKIVPYTNNLATLPAYCAFGYIYKDSFFVNGGYNTDVPTVDSLNPINPDVWVDELPSFTVETVDSGKKITLNLPTTYVLTGKKSYTITARTITDYQSSANLYRIIYNLETDDLSIIRHVSAIPNGYIFLGVLHTEYGIFMNGCVHHASEKALTLAPLILGASGAFVEFDGVHGSVKFPDDTLIQINRNGGSVKHYQLSNAKGNNVATFDPAGGTALIVVYNIESDSLSVVRYNTKIAGGQIALATFRLTGQVSILAPYSFNGKPFNMDFSSMSVAVDSVNYNVKAINHRGYNVEAPENTISAFNLSVKHGFEYIEADVRFTKDGVSVILHDATVDRTSDGTGTLAELTYAQVRALDFGSWYSSRFTGEKIPSFIEFISFCKSKGVHPYIEIKDEAITEARANQLVTIVRRFGMLDNVTFISAKPTNLNNVKKCASSVRLGYVVEEITDDNLTTVTSYKFNFIDVHHTTITDKAIMKAMAAGVPVEVWTPNDEGAIVNMNPYISGVTSNYIHAGKVLHNMPIEGDIASLEYITFTIETSTEYVAIDGMTYGDWVNSEYNTGGYYYESGSLKNSNGNELLYVKNGTPSDTVYESDIIDPFADISYW